MPTPPLPWDGYPRVRLPPRHLVEQTRHAGIIPQPSRRDGMESLVSLHKFALFFLQILQRLYDFPSRRCHTLDGSWGTGDGRPRGERLGRATPPVSKEPEHGYTSYVDLPVPGRTEHRYWVLCRAHCVWNLLWGRETRWNVSSVEPPCWLQFGGRLKSNRWLYKGIYTVDKIGPPRLS